MVIACRGMVARRERAPKLIICLGASCIVLCRFDAKVRTWSVGRLTAPLASSLTVYGFCESGVVTPHVVVPVLLPEVLGRFCPVLSCSATSADR